MLIKSWTKLKSDHVCFKNKQTILWKYSSSSTKLREVTIFVKSCANCKTLDISLLLLEVFE